MEYNSKDKLAKLGIYQLRVIGREVGVKLPTTYRKNELIDKIMDVISGQETPYTKQTKKGRPPKGFCGGVDYSTKDKNVIKYNIDSNYGFSQLNSATFDVPENADDEIEEISGYLDVLNNGLGLIVPMVGNVYGIVKTTEIQLRKLKTGDKIVALCRKFDNNNPYIAFDFIAINDNLENKHFNFNEAKAKDKPMCFNQLGCGFYYDICKCIDYKFKFGDKVLFKSGDRRMMSLGAYGLSRYFQSCENTKVVCLLANTSEMYLQAFANLDNIELIHSKFGDNEAMQTNIILLAIQRIKVLLEMGNINVVLVMNDLEVIIKLLERAGHPEAVQIIKNLIKQAKQTSENSFTICYGLTNSSIMLNIFESNETMLVEYLDYEGAKGLYFKGNILKTSRNEVFNDERLDDFDKYLKAYLRNGDYITNHLHFEEMVCRGMTKEEIIEEIKIK